MNNVAAISTPIGIGGISIIKVSGDSAISEVNKIFSGKNLLEVKSHTLNYGYILEGDSKIDEVLVAVMRAPHTFTGEDIVEINCHGGILITQRILQLLLTLDIELAQPGEFTKRAFLNGKKTVDQAQATMDIINAKSEMSLQLAINSLNSSSEQLLKQLLAKLMDIITQIEVHIDYPEYEDLQEVTNDIINNQVQSLIDDINEIITDSKRGSLIKNGIKTAIVGLPNAGKSSLLNLLSKENKAIVTAIAGTTRDIVENEINLNGILLNLLDTAGIRQTDDVVEQIGVERSYEAIKQAQIVIHVIDGSVEASELDLAIINEIKSANKPHITLINKNDLPQLVDINNYENSLQINTNDESLIKAIEIKLLEQLDLKEFDINSQKILNNTTQLNELQKVRELLLLVQANGLMGFPIDTLEIDLKEATYILSEMLGLNPKENLINELFSRFCLGK